MSFPALSTPCLLVERARLAQNLSHMQAHADANEVRLRPHVKTHKSVELAEQQRAHGAVGLTVATVEEAAAFIEAGAEDVRVAYPVTGRNKHEHLAALSDQACVACTVDTPAGIDQAAAVHADRRQPLDVLMEVDVGHGRCGVPWDDADATVHLARRIVDRSGLRLVGILTHAGQAYDGPSEGESPEAALQRVAGHERDRMLTVATRLAAADVSGVVPGEFEISIGSTPSMAAFENAERDGFRITEIRPGNYVVHDAMQVALGAATLSNWALTVLTTVVSTKSRSEGPDRAFVDAGKKILTMDTGAGTEGHGIVLSDAATMTPASEICVDRLSEEHGWLALPDAGELAVGDRLRLVPNHACVSIATQSRMYLVDGEQIVAPWAVG